MRLAKHEMNYFEQIIDLTKIFEYINQFIFY